MVNWILTVPHEWLVKFSVFFRFGCVCSLLFHYCCVYLFLLGRWSWILHLTIVLLFTTILSKPLWKKCQIWDDENEYDSYLIMINEYESYLIMNKIRFRWRVRGFVTKRQIYYIKKIGGTIIIFSYWFFCVFINKDIVRQLVSNKPSNSFLLNPNNLFFFKFFDPYFFKIDFGWLVK